MLIYTIGFNATTRRIEKLGISTEERDNVIGTQNDNNNTVLKLVIDGEIPLGYGARVEFDTYVEDKNLEHTRYKPFMLFDDNDEVIVPISVMKSAKATRLPIQIVFENAVGDRFASINMLNLIVADSVSSTQLVDDYSPDSFMQALKDADFDEETDMLVFSNFTGGYQFISVDRFLRANLKSSAWLDAGDKAGNVPIIDETGKLPISIMPNTVTTEHFTVNTVSELTGLSDAENGDLATVIDENSLYVLFGLYSSIDNWMPVYNDDEVIEHINNKNNPHNTTKAQVGLSNVRNVESYSKQETNALNDTINSKISKEITDRTNADTQLNTKITNETNARTNADTQINARITTESTTRADADNALGADIDTIESKIPINASPANQLADKNFVNSSINSVSAFYLTYNAQGDVFPTKASLNSATVFYYVGTTRVPSMNDYVVVMADESQDGAQTRYVYQNQNNVGVWAFQYKINDTPFTSDQWASINSEINKTLVEKLIGIEAGAQVNTVKSVAGKTGVVVLNKSDIGLGNVDNTSDANKPISTAMQTALNGKQAIITGGASTITSSDLTASRALVSDANGKVAVSSKITTTELEYLDGVTSGVQSQLNGKVSKSGDMMTDALGIFHNGHSLYFRNSLDDRSIAPSESHWNNLRWLDKNNQECGGIQFTHTTDDVFRLSCYLNNGSLKGWGPSWTLDRNGNAYFTAPTPSNSAENSTKVATTAWVNTADCIVHKTGNEDIAGYKKFINGMNIALNLPEGATGDAINQLNFIDNGNKSRGSVLSFHDNTRDTTALIVTNLNGTYLSELSITRGSDNTVRTYAPEPAQNANANEIITAGWVNDKLNAKVPTSRKVNGKQLSNDITLSASDVGALPSGGNAVSATKAIQDGDGNVIVNTYATQTALNGKAPVSHASTGTGYGVSSATDYGHAMASGTTPKANGTASVGSEIGKFARGDHVHPLQTTITGNAGSATKLATGRTVRVNLASTGTSTFDGTANITPGVFGVLPVENGGTGSTSIDIVPTANSTNLVTSGGVRTALDTVTQINVTLNSGVASGGTVTCYKYGKMVVISLTGVTISAGSDLDLLYNCPKAIMNTYVQADSNTRLAIYTNLTTVKAYVDLSGESGEKWITLIYLTE